MNNSQKNNKTNALLNLFDSFSELIINDEEEAKNILQEEGYDPEKVREKGENYVAKLLSRKKLELLKQQTIDKYERAKKAFYSSFSFQTEQIETLSKILYGEKVPQVQFNKLKVLAKEDILEMLTEAQLIEFIEKTDSDENN